MKSIITSILLICLLFNLFLPLALFATEPELSSSFISIRSNVDGASIFLDTKETGLLTPLAEPVKTEPGYHMIRIEKEGFSTWRKDFIVTSGENMEIEAILLPVEVTEGQRKAFKNMDKKPINKRWWFWVIVLAAVGAAVSSSDGGSSDGGSVLVTW